MADSEQAKALAIYDLAVRMYEEDHAEWRPASWDSIRPHYGDEPPEVRGAYLRRAREALEVRDA